SPPLPAPAPTSGRSSRSAGTNPCRCCPATCATPGCSTIMPGRIFCSDADSPRAAPALSAALARPLPPRPLRAPAGAAGAGGRCQSCGRPHLAQLRCLPDGRWFDPAAATWRDRRGRPCRWPDLVEAVRLRTTRVVLAAAHLDGDPSKQPAAQPACALPALPPAARPPTPPGATPDHLPSALGHRRPVPRPL